MSVEPLNPGDSVGAARGEVVVVIPVFGALQLFAACLEGVVASVDAGIRLIVADDATPGTGVAELLAGAGRPIHHLRQPRNVGFPANVNAAFAAAAPADVAVVNSDCVVAPGWLDALRDAVASDSRIATASALSNHGSIVSVPDRNQPRSELPGSPEARNDTGGPPAAGAVGEVAGAIAAGSLRLRPRLPTAIGHCFYVRRSALELVGDFDTAFSPGYGEEVDFSQRCLLHGLVHVLADDAFVFHRGRGSFAAGRQIEADHERMIEERYPHYRRLVAHEAGTPRGPLADAVGAARRSLRGLSVTIDASALGPVVMGTQVTTLELVRALDRRGEVRLRVVVPRTVAAHARAVLDATDAEIVFVDEIERSGPRSDVVHRPSQVLAKKHLDWLNRLGERIVITHQDLIAYDNPGYFGSYDEFDEHRTLTRQSLALADVAVFISEHVRGEAIARELIEPSLTRVIHQGVDRAAGASQSTAPAGLGATPAGEPLLLCLGTDYLHKNRVFALRMLGELRARGFGGRLALAGPRAEHGSSRPTEEALLRADPGLSDAVVTLGEVSEEEKRWLYQHAALVLYPTVAEGFGLVPFEAAAHGVACMFAPGTSLAELLPREAATLTPWDAGASAERALRLLEGEGATLAAQIDAHGRAYRWERTASELTMVYRDVVRRPPRAARAILFGEALDELALSLVGPGGYLQPDVQRALLAVAARPALRRPLFAGLEASYRLLRALRRRRGGPGG